MTDYKPGTVVVATVRGHQNVRVFRCHNYHGTPEQWATGEAVDGYWLHGDKLVTDIRPLVVLDVSDAPAPKGTAAYIDWVESQIEAQTKPPRIPEPGKYGIVRASGQGLDDMEWVNEGKWWVSLDDSISPHRRWGEWRDLIDPVLIREGVEG